MIVSVKLLPGGTMPVRATAGAAGLDCYAPASGCVHVGGRAIIPLGFAVEIPPGWAAHVVSRSGLAKNWGVVEYWGTIDSDYRGEVKAMLFNHGQETYRWEAGERVCQLLFLQVPQVELVQVPELGTTARGPRGFGSTGEKAIGYHAFIGPSSVGYTGYAGLDYKGDWVKAKIATCLECGANLTKQGCEHQSKHDVLSRALRPYRVLDGDPSVGESVCPSCGATFVHAEGCPETKK